MTFDPKFYKGAYRVPSNRTPDFDYGQDNMYFVTICTYNKRRYFGDIFLENNIQSMKCSELGEVAKTCWQDIPNHFPFVLLGDWIVMPNHIHGVFIFDKQRHDQYERERDRDVHSDTNSNIDHDPTRDVHGDTNSNIDHDPCRDARSCVSTAGVTGCADVGVAVGMTGCTDVGVTVGVMNDIIECEPKTNTFGPQSRNLASVVRGFKIGVTKYARQKLGIEQVWQPRFHDRIIRSELEFWRVSEYIIQNPANWREDVFYI